jgi:uncharacterized protein YgbK (DUF1537 family)
MVVAIADDFTGAAELGGAGLRYGLTCEIRTGVPECSEADLLIITTNTRSLADKNASREIKRILEELDLLPVQWIYKKVDSLLRGHVLKEIKAVSEYLGNDKVLLVPANPSLGRTISGGSYFVDGQPLHETDLRYNLPKDRSTSNVISLLNTSGKEDLTSLKPDQPFLDHRFTIGDANSATDLKKWAKRGISGHRILAGAAEFFDALLQVSGHQPITAQPHTLPKSSRCLFVCGSTSDYSRKFVSDALKKGCQVCNIPEGFFDAGQSSKESITKWVTDIIEAFSQHQKVVVAINRPLVRDTNLAKQLLHYMAIVIERVVSQEKVDELLVEGGATAFSITKQLQTATFFPLQELAPGVVQMKADGESAFHLTVKPGSYPWPDEIVTSLTKATNL